MEDDDKEEDDDDANDELVIHVRIDGKLGGRVVAAIRRDEGSMDEFLSDDGAVISVVGVREALKFAKLQSDRT